MKAGIYEIRNTVNGKRYVGSTFSFQRRWRDHRWDLRRRGHRSQLLQRAWDKYGSSAFVFRPLIICHKRDLLFYEQCCLDAFNPEYNVCRIAASTLGYKHSNETLSKMRAAWRHRAPLSAEALANRAAGQRGRKLTAAHVEKMRAARTGKRWTEEMRAKMRGNQNARGVLKRPETIEAHRAVTTALWRDEAFRAKALIGMTRKPTRSSTGFRGVHRHGRGFCAGVCNDYLGYFKDAGDAARAYDVAAKQRFGEHASLNFKSEPPK